ncbi:MAG TPA: response regulator [Solirubrobacteraceae bacterium]|jgi:CheY-like chemotaxis protein
MARVLALVPDLLFGSRVQSMLRDAGHDVELVSGETEVWDQIAGTDVLVVDLTDADLDGIGLIDTLMTGGEMHGVRTLGFYSHVEAHVRERALAAGFDAVVPRSRMAREGAALVESLA